MTGNLQPLIDSAAMWVVTDAKVRVFWAIIGGTLSIATFIIIAFYCIRAIRFLLTVVKK